MIRIFLRHWRLSTFEAWNAKCDANGWPSARMEPWPYHERLWRCLGWTISEERERIALWFAPWLRENE